MAANDYYDNHPAQAYYSQPPQSTGHTHGSPFDGPFEDSAYPLAAASSHGMDSHTTLQPPDSRYYGQGGGGRPQDSQTSFHDDIPLRDHSAGPAKGDEPTDHVYDAPPPVMGEQRSNRRGRNFSKSRLAKIPWVVYILTLIQVAVFIAELAKNGRWASTPRWVMLT